MMTLGSMLAFNSIQQMLDQFFYQWDDRVKPPCAAEPISNDPNKQTCDGVTIQLALAGYKREDVEVYSEKNVLYVKGDNTKRPEVNPKFRSVFTNRFPVSKELDLSKAIAELEDGLLTITIPLSKESSPRNYLLSK